MKEKVNRIDVGIIVGRFHTHELHEAHKDLINTVLSKHDRVIVFLGNSPLKNTVKNPLDFRARRAMINDDFPNVEVHYINDIPGDDDAWSKQLDKLIREQLTPTQTVMLYGSRDSFLKKYSGKFPTCELESTTFVSATEIRRKVCNNYPPTKDYRAGLIASTAFRFPTAFQTVDVAVINDKNEILLAKKPNEKKLRFIGGFSDPSSPSLELDAKREVMEEGGIEIDNITYLGSVVVDDPRYRGEVDCIKTALFVAKYIFGRPVGGDDVESVQWVSLKDLKEDMLMPVHHVLLEIFNKKFSNNEKMQEFFFGNKDDGKMP